MTRRRRLRSRRVAAGVVAAVLCAVGGIYLASRPVSHRVQPDSAISVGHQPTVTVERQSVAEVISLQASVLASPMFAVDAVGSAPISPAAGLAVGGQVRAGQVLFTQGTVSVRAPVAAVLASWLVAPGTVPSLNLPVLSLRYTGFGLSAILAAEDGYRILANPVMTRGEITNGPGPFACVFLPSYPQQSPSTGGAGTVGTPSVVCAIPSSVRAFDGLGGVLSVTSGQANNALVLPTFAVIGSADDGQVYVVGKDGQATQRSVGLGITNGGTVQITSGLSAGDTVLANPPAFGASS